jgi:hypothetical protein
MNLSRYTLRFWIFIYFSVDFVNDKRQIFVGGGGSYLMLQTLVVLQI